MSDNCASLEEARAGIHNFGIPLTRKVWRFKRWAAWVVIPVLLGCYSLQIVSPLRLTPDSVVLLSVADSVSHGGAFLDQGRPTVYPPAYPAVLAVLIKMGLGRSSVIISVNLILLFAALAGARQVLILAIPQLRASAFWICVLCALSYVLVKHVAMPLTDVAFFCAAMWALVAFERASALEPGRAALFQAILGWGLTLLAISIRRTGITLIPAFLYAVSAHPSLRPFLARIPRRMKIVLSISFGVAILTAAVAALLTSTLLDLAIATANTSVPEFMLRIVSYRFTELGELACNVPVSKAPAVLRVLILPAGVIALTAVLRGIHFKRTNLNPTDLFFCSYLGVLIVWPYMDPRFWLPAIPLLVAYAILAIQRLSTKFVLVCAAIYCTLFVLAGCAALIYSTKMTFAGPRFAERYADISLRPSYCEVFRSCSQNLGAGKPDPKVVYLLKRYE